jgi:hypothetical protein
MVGRDGLLACVVAKLPPQAVNSLFELPLAFLQFDDGECCVPAAITSCFEPGQAIADPAELDMQVLKPDVLFAGSRCRLHWVDS